MIGNKEMIILGKEKMKWIIVANTYKERLAEFIENGNTGIRQVEIVDYLKENNIPYLIVGCTKRRPYVIDQG